MCYVIKCYVNVIKISIYWVAQLGAFIFPTVVLLDLETTYSSVSQTFSVMAHILPEKNIAKHHQENVLQKVCLLKYDNLVSIIKAGPVKVVFVKIEDKPNWIFHSTCDYS